MMDQAAHDELIRLKEKQRQLRFELEQIAAGLDALELRLQTTPQKIDSLPIPPVLVAAPLVQDTKPGVPSTVEGLLHRQRAVSPAPDPVLAESVAVEPTAPGATASPPRDAGSLEMKLGTFWFARVGIVMLLTGLVWLAYLVYGRIGVGGRVGLLYLVGGGLLAFGSWLQKSSTKTGLRNYGQLLFAGGLASIYFTTYAAHYVENLRVINSPLVDGFLLLAWTATMVFLADQRKSEVLALFAVGLAYYTSVVTRIGFFTLYSNLILTLAATFFLIRNRWARLSLLSLVATYGGFAFWRFYESGWSIIFRGGSAELVYANFFLTGYWFLFTAAVLLSRAESWTEQLRALFASANNAAYFCLVLLSMSQFQRGGFWKFSLAFGTVLLVIAFFRYRKQSEDTLLAGAYLTQGLLLVTIGLTAYFSGLHLALVLAAETCALTVLGTRTKNRIIIGGSYVVATLAAVIAMGEGWGARQIELFNFVVGGLLLISGVSRSQNNDGRTKLFRNEVAWFIFLGLSTWFVGLWPMHDSPAYAAVLCGLVLVLTGSVYLLKVPELVFFGQGYLLFAQFHCLLMWRFGGAGSGYAWMVILTTLALGHWWRRRSAPGESAAEVFSGFYALAATILLAAQLNDICPTTSNWMVALAGTSVGLTLYALVTDYLILAAAAQLLLLGSALLFFFLHLTASVPPTAAMVPLAAWWVQRAIAMSLVSRWPTARLAGFACQLMATLITVIWIAEHVEITSRPAAYALLAVLAFLWRGFRQDEPMIYSSAAFALFAFGRFFVSAGMEVSLAYWQTFVWGLAFLLLQRLSRRRPVFAMPQAVHQLVVMLVCLVFWVLASQWIIRQTGSHLFLTATWAILALAFFACGLLLKEKAYRWAGLAILGGAVGRVVMSDIWKLQIIYRVLSFLALGAVLLVLGFVYNKYQDKIKQWL